MFAAVFAWWKMTSRRGACRPADLARAVAFSSRYKFALGHLSRDDIAALTREASAVSGIPYIMDVDQGVVDRILDGGRSE